MGNGRVVLPGGLQGQGVPRVDVGQALAALIEHVAQPPVTEWLVIEGARMGVMVLPDGSRHLDVIPQGSRRGYRIPMDGIAAVQVGKALMERTPNEAVVPESDEVAAAQAPAPFEPLPTDDEPPTPPTMGQG